MNIITEVSNYLKNDCIGEANKLTNSFLLALSTQTRKELGDIYIKKAQELITSKRYSEAFKLIEFSYKIDKYNKEIIRMLANVYLIKAKHCNDEAESKKLLRDALRLNPKLDEARQLLLKSESITEKEKEKLLKSNIKSNNDLLSKLKLCNNYLKDKRINQALDILKNIEYDETNKEIVLLYAKIDIIHGNIEDAINRLLKLRENDYDVRVELTLGRLYTRTERYDEAFPLIYNAYIKNQNDIYRITELINYYIVTNRFQEALYLFEKNFKSFSAVESLKNGYIRNTRYYIKHMLQVENKTAQNYIECQILQYSEAELLKKLYKYSEKPHGISVKPEFKCSILNILEYSKEKIENMLPIDKDLLDTYIIKSDTLEGKINTIITNTFEVKTISNTKNIVEILPICNEYAESTTIKNNVKKMGEK